MRSVRSRPGLDPSDGLRSPARPQLGHGRARRTRAELFEPKDAKPNRHRDGIEGRCVGGGASTGCVGGYPPSLSACAVGAPPQMLARPLRVQISSHTARTAAETSSKYMKYTEPDPPRTGSPCSCMHSRHNSTCTRSPRTMMGTRSGPALRTARIRALRQDTLRSPQRAGLRRPPHR